MVSLSVPASTVHNNVLSLSFRGGFPVMLMTQLQDPSFCTDPERVTLSHGALNHKFLSGKREKLFTMRGSRSFSGMFSGFVMFVVSHSFFKCKFYCDFFLSLS